MIARYYLLGVALLVMAGCAHISSDRYAPAKVAQPSDNFVFEAKPSIIRAGETALLRWNIRGAATVTIEEASGEDKLRVIGTFAATGTLEVRPQVDSTYVVSCQGDTEVACASVFVRVRVRRP